MLAPLHLDTHSVRQATSFEARTGPLVSGLTSPWSHAAVDLTLSNEQTQHFTYWNYIAIRAICDSFSEPFPNVGYPVKRKRGETQSLTRRQAEWVAKKYRQQSWEPWSDLQPLEGTHPLMELLARVNPEDSWGEFVYELGLYWHLTGRFYVWVIPDGFGMPSELWVIPTPWVDPIYRKNGTLERYDIIPDGDRSRKMPLPPEEVLWGRFKSPRSKIEGWSGMHAGPGWIDNAESIERARWFCFKNGINPDVILEFDLEKYRAIQEDELTRIKEKFIARAAGVKRAGEPLLSPPGVKVTKWSHTPREMDFSDSAIQVRDFILALWGVPPIVAGISADYNRATSEAADASFCKRKMNPLLRLFAGILTERLAPRYDERICVWYDDCVPKSTEEEREETKLDWEMGAISPDERRAERGREPWGLPEAETGWMPTGRTPLDPALLPELPEDDLASESSDDDEPADDKKE